MFLNLFWFAAPLPSIKNIWQHPWLVYDTLIFTYNGTHGTHATLLCNGTPVGNYWSYLSERKWEFQTQKGQKNVTNLTLSI